MAFSPMMRSFENIAFCDTGVVTGSSPLSRSPDTNHPYRLNNSYQI